MPARRRPGIAAGMSLFYLALAIGIAVLMNLRARWGRLAGQALAAIALMAPSLPPQPRLVRCWRWN